jgi:TolA-binding protein
VTQTKSRNKQKIRIMAERKLETNPQSDSAFGFDSKPLEVQPLMHIKKTLAQPNAGQALDSSLRSELEPQFGHDFANVRVHADSQADQMAKSLNANAFVTGQDVFFREGMFKPDSSDGKQLLAHELTHTVQQSRGTTTSTDLAVSKPNDQLEQAAQTQANAIMNARGGQVAPGTVSNLIQREIHDPSAETSRTSSPSPESTSEASTASSSTPGSPVSPALVTPTAANRTAMNRAVELYEQGHYLRAGQAFERLASDFPSEQNAFLHNACQAYSRVRENLETRRINHEVDVAVDDPATRTRAEQAMLEGNRAYATHQFARAAQFFLEAYQAVPAPEFQFNLAMAHLHSGHPADALEAFGIARAGGTHVPQRLIRQAEEERNRSHDISSRDLDALTGTEADAIEAIVSEASLDDSRTLYHTAARAFIEHRYDDAIRQFDDIQTLLTSSTGHADVNLFWNEAQARFRAENFVGAVPFFRRALSLD